MTSTFKQHIISFLITFVTGFAISVVPVLGTADLSTLGHGVLAGIVLGGIRAGFKYVSEKWIVPQQ